MDNILEEVSRERNRHEDRLADKEAVLDLDEAALSKSLNKVKEMYRDSMASVANKLSRKGNKSGIFFTEIYAIVITHIYLFTSCTRDFAQIYLDLVKYKLSISYETIANILLAMKMT